MSEDIIRFSLDDFNHSKSQKEITCKPVSTDVVVATPEFYHVAIEKFKIPINKYRYIDMVEKPYYVNIFCDLKTGIPGDLVYGNNIFEITGPIMSETELIQKMNDIVFKKPQPITLGRFSLDYVSNTPTLYFTVQTSELVNWNDFEVYIDERLMDVFNFQYTSESMPYNDELLFKLALVEGKQEQESFSFNKINKIDAIRVKTSLPINAHFISNSYNNTLQRSSLILEVYYNSNQLLFNSDIYYIPTMLIDSCLLSSAPITNFNLEFYYKYKNGYERRIYASRGESSLCTVKFTKKI